MARFFLLMNYISLNKPPFFHLFHLRTKKKHLLISWLFRVVKGVILFAPRTSDPNGKRSPTFRASLTWKESYFLKRWTSWSHTFSLLGLVFYVTLFWGCFAVGVGETFKNNNKNLKDQSQIQWRFWLFKTEVLVSQRISANDSWFVFSLNTGDMLKTGDCPSTKMISWIFCKWKGENTSTERVATHEKSRISTFPSGIDTLELN